MNGKFVGYSEDSKLEAEFNLTSYLKPGQKNLIAFQVSAGATAVIWKIRTSSGIMVLHAIAISIHAIKNVLKTYV